MGFKCQPPADNRCDKFQNDDDPSLLFVPVYIYLAPLCRAAVVVSQPRRLYKDSAVDGGHWKTMSREQ